MALWLNFKDVEQALAAMHSVPDERRVAFRARFKHLQRLGFPPGVNTGKGKPAQYGPEQIVALAIAFELIELGNTPERAVSNVRAFWPELVRVIDATRRQGHSSHWAIAAFYFRALAEAAPQQGITTFLVDPAAERGAAEDLRHIVGMTGAVMVNVSQLIAGLYVHLNLTSDQAVAFIRTFETAANQFSSGERLRA